MAVDAKSQCRDRSRHSSSSLTLLPYDNYLLVPTPSLSFSHCTGRWACVYVVVVVMEGPLRIESPYLRSLIVGTVPYTLQHIYPREDEEADDPRQAASQARR